ncbi:MAG: sigma 54-interacting transcriptional regulator [Arenicellales bacterium]|nr:sigma 54-interacting transcriptional regulator [Arenicellales bacterium]
MMIKVGKQTLIIASLLFAAGAYVVFVFFPIVANTYVLGYGGRFTEDRFEVTRILTKGPAYEAGLRRGDTIYNQAGHPTTEWYHWYTTDLTTYNKARAELLREPAVYTLSLGPPQRDLEFQPRALTVREVLSLYGVRIFLIFFVLGLTVYILVSRTKERSAFLTCMCFCFAVIWFASDQPYWPQFNSPLIRELSVGWSNFVDLLEVFSIQIVLGILLHMALVFPQERPVLERNRWLPVPIYFAALVVPVAILLFGEGELAIRIMSIYKPRIVVNSVLIILITALMVDSYRRCDSPAYKEQARWIVISMGIVAAAHLVFWNIPTLLTGSALASNYNWMLLTVVLLPISLTMSITNHELFGIRGMIRGRIRLLETMLNRERRLVGTRDLNIQSMQREIHRLEEALEQYTVMEQQDVPDSNEGLEKLERQYPELNTIRQQRLIGISPLWKEVFEQTVLAAHGKGPVMIVGESGTGKTDVAWAVHRLSDRKDEVYKEISCAQFEHTDPAFALGRLFGIGSGHGLPNVAKEGRKGLLEECDGGTLLLDDFDRLPLNVQDLFLYPLEGKRFDPGIGSGPSKNVSVKFIFATNSEPERLVEDGRFRNDVLARMVTRINIPPLRQRKEDIPLLVEHFIKQFSLELGHDISVVSTKALNLLQGYSYESGNVRELRAELQKAVSKALLEDDNILRAGYLSEKMRVESIEGSTTTPRQTGDEPAKDSKLVDSVELDVLRRHRFQITSAEAELGYSHKSRTLSNHLRGMCIQALVDSSWDTGLAAKTLAGENNQKEIYKLKAKIERFVNRIEENIKNKTENKLFNNLPMVYHEALNKTIAKMSEARRLHRDHE